MIHHQKVLLIDDDQSFLDVMQIALEMEGYKFTGVRQTDDIGTLVRQELPDLILIDYCLPGRSGGELCNDLNKFSDLNIIKRVLLSAYPKEKLPLDNIVFDDFLPKPFDLGIFLAAIYKLINMDFVELRKTIKA